MKRVFNLDVLKCPECGTRRRLIALIKDPPVIQAILTRSGLPTDPPIIAPARARRRGEAVHELPGRPGLRCNWMRIAAGEEEIVADFSDPFDDGMTPAPDRAAETVAESEAAVGCR